MRLIFFLKIFACGSDPFSFTLRCVHVEIAMLSCGNYTVLSSVVVLFFQSLQKAVIVKMISSDRKPKQKSPLIQIQTVISEERNVRNIFLHIHSSIFNSNLPFNLIRCSWIWHCYCTCVL